MLSDLDLLIIVSDEYKYDKIQNTTSELITDLFINFGLTLSLMILNVDQWTKDERFLDLKTDIIQHHIQLTGERPELQ